MLKQLISRRGLLIAAALAAAAAAGYFTRQGSTPASLYRIAVVLPSDRNPFWLDVRQGAVSAGQVIHGKATLQVLASNDQDATSQLAILDNLLSRRAADAVVLGPANDSTVVPRIAQLLAAKIPVIVIDTELDSKALASAGLQAPPFIGSSNRDGGQRAARAMADAIGKRGLPKKVLLIEGSFVHQSAIDRTEGFVEAGQPLGLDIERVKGEWRQDRAQELTASRITRDQYGGVFANNDDMALGAIAALKSSRLPQDKWPLVFGFDATRDAIEAIKRGELFATVKQDAQLMGSEGVLAALKTLLKENFPRRRLLDVQVVGPN